jgi:hypothetical protein
MSPLDPATLATQLQHEVVRRCHPFSCLECKSGNAKFCSGCKSISFCGTACQKAAWKHHKRVCKVFQAVRADESKESARSAESAECEDPKKSGASKGSRGGPVTCLSAASDINSIKTLRKKFFELHGCEPTALEAPQLDNFPRCNTCGKTAVKFKLICSTCRMVGYCSEGCRDSALGMTRTTNHDIELCSRMQRTTAAASILAEEAGAPGVVSPFPTTPFSCSGAPDSVSGSDPHRDSDSSDPLNFGTGGLVRFSECLEKREVVVHGRFVSIRDNLEEVCRLAQAAKYERPTEKTESATDNSQILGYYLNQILRKLHTDSGFRHVLDPDMVWADVNTKRGGEDTKQGESGKTKKTKSSDSSLLSGGISAEWSNQFVQRVTLAVSIVGEHASIPANKLPASKVRMVTLAKRCLDALTDPYWLPWSNYFESTRFALGERAIKNFDTGLQAWVADSLSAPLTLLLGLDLLGERLSGDGSGSVSRRSGGKSIDDKCKSGSRLSSGGNTKVHTANVGNDANTGAAKDTNSDDRNRRFSQSFRDSLIVHKKSGEIGECDGKQAINRKFNHIDATDSPGEVILHVIGPRARDVLTTAAWEEILHRWPAVKKLSVYLVGPEMKIRHGQCVNYGKEGAPNTSPLCAGCQSRNRSIDVHFVGEKYEEFVARSSDSHSAKAGTKSGAKSGANSGANSGAQISDAPAFRMPSACVAYNCGFSTSNDDWAPCLRLFAKSKDSPNKSSKESSNNASDESSDVRSSCLANVPLIITAQHLDRALQDVKFMEETAGAACVVKPQRNPFASPLWLPDVRHLSRGTDSGRESKSKSKCKGGSKSKPSADFDCGAAFTANNSIAVLYGGECREEYDGVCTTGGA